MEAISQTHKEEQSLINDTLESCNALVKSILDEQEVIYLPFSKVMSPMIDYRDPMKIIF